MSPEEATKGNFHSKHTAMALNTVSQYFFINLHNIATYSFWSLAPRLICLRSSKTLKIQLPLVLFSPSLFFFPFFHFSKDSLLWTACLGHPRQDSYVETLTSNVMVLGCMAFRRWLGHEGSTLERS